VTRLIRALLCCALVALALPHPARSTTVPAGYPSNYVRIIKQAELEGQLTVWSVTDTRRAGGLLAGFRRLYPNVRVEYVELTAQNLYQRFLADAHAGRGTADLLWSSAMDLQIKLVNDGYSQAYVSPERGKMPEWAIWKNEAWGITAEPIVFAYNRKAMRTLGRVPGTHLDLIRFLNRNNAALKGRIATYDPATSAVGYLYLAQDKQANHNTWDLVRAMGRAKVRLYPTADDILTRLGDGRLAFGYDLIGSYALDAQARNPDIGVVVPRDYALIMSRIAMIPAHAKHPNASRLFLDYLLSETGQRHLAANYMTPVRIGLPANRQLAVASARAIRVGPALLVHQDRLTRKKFLRDWSRALGSE